MQYSELSLKICNIIQDISFKEVIPSFSLREDLGFDDLDYVEIAMKLENNFDITIDDDLTKCKIVQNVIEYVEKKLNNLIF